MSRPAIFIASLIATLGFNPAVIAQESTAGSHPQISNSQPTRPSVKAERPAIKPGDPGCLRDTGSLIPPKSGQCLPVTGRSYSGDDLRRTGTPNTARALQMLDPSISVGH